MDASPITALVLTVMFGAIGLYALYFTIPAAVRDGIRATAKRLATQSATPDE
ncbi:hypothetical protein V3C33_18645 [Micrococcaceae bacterium Sec5.7]